MEQKNEKINNSKEIKENRKESEEQVIEKHERMYVKKIKDECKY